MQGYLITFFTELNRRHQGKQIHEWLLALAQQLHLRGVTISAASTGLDHAGHIHSASFFELADQPVKIQFVLSPQEADVLFSHIQQEQLQLFYVKVPAEFGTLG